MKSINVKLRKIKRDISFEMVIDPFVFSTDFSPNTIAHLF